MATYYVRPDGNNANTGIGDSAAAAWQTAKYGMQFASNGVIANGDTLHVVADQGTYTENGIVVDRAIIARGLRGTATISGTGGAAGSDIITHGVAAVFIDIEVRNAVDKGFAWTASVAHFRRCGAVSCGGDGFYRTHGSGTARYCYARSNGGKGFAEDSAGLIHDYFACEAGDNVSHGLMGGTGNTQVNKSISYDNGGDGLNLLTAPDATAVVANSTFEGNTGDGVETVGTPSPGFLFLNNVLSNNGGSGAKAAGTGVQISDYNDFFGNGTARTNWPTGPNDVAVDPLYVNAGGDDYTLDTGSPLIGAGWSPFKSPMKMNIGATLAETAVGGGLLTHPGMAGGMRG